MISAVNNVIPMSSLSFGAKNALLAKAAAASWKMKLVLVPVGAASGALGVASGAAGIGAAVSTGIMGIATAIKMVHLA